MDDLERQVREYIQDFRDHRDAGELRYWLADHQMLATALACIIVGAISLSFKYAELRLQQSMIGVGNG
jgi:hypothetical protein